VKVAIIGSALSGNKGAAAMLESSVQHLTAADPSTRVVLLSMYPRSDAEQNTYENVRVLDASPLRLGVVINGAALLHRLLPPLRKRIEAAVPEVGALARADVLLDEGGITFVDGRGKYIIYNVATLLPALFVRTPVVKIAQALGPFEEPVNGFAAKALLPKVAAIVARGAVTRSHLDTLGLTNVVDGADLAFTLQVQPAEDAAAGALAGDFFDDGGVVGFSPSVVLKKNADAAGDDYVADVVAQIDHVTGDLGRKVLLVAHSARAHTDKTHNNDLPLCREIFSRLAHPEMVLFPDAEVDSQVLRALIGRCETFVASRFHAMVSALATGVPVLVVGWSHKYREVLDMFGLAEWAVPHADLTAAGFRTKMADLLERAPQVAETIENGLPSVQARALEQIDIVRDVAAGRR
jgi:colanic acid/amylovoran biosynthesis protein